MPAYSIPPIDHPLVAALAREINADATLTKVKVAGSLMPPGLCYWNVAQVAQKNGGSIELGWAIFWRPGLYIEAMHHAVWRMPDQRLLDVTEGYLGKSAPSHTVFLPDNRISVDLTRPPNIVSKFLHLTSHPALTDHFEVYARMHEVSGEYIDLLWELGYRAEGNFAASAGREVPLTNFNGRPPHLLSRLRTLMTEVQAWRNAMDRCANKLSAIEP